MQKAKIIIELHRKKNKKTKELTLPDSKIYYEASTISVVIGTRISK